MNATQAYLSDSEKRYKILIENIKDCLFESESDGTLTYVSPQIYDILGYKPEEMIGENQFDYIHKNDLSQVSDSFNKVSKTGETITNEFKMLHKNGSYINVSAKGDSIKINGSRNFIVVLRDITERRKDENIINEQIKELSCLYTLSDILEEKDIKLEDIFVRAVKLLPPAWQFPETTYARIIVEGEEYNTDNFRETKWKQSSNIVVNGEKIGVVEVFYLDQMPNFDEGIFLKEERDLINEFASKLSIIIERKKAEKELINLQKRNRAWLENSPICTKILDLDFNLQYMSASGIRDLQIDDITQHYGKPYPFYFYPESFKNQMTGNLRKAKETGQIIEQEASVVDIEGTELWYHSTIVPIRDDKDQFEYIIVVSVETTKRKQAEDALKESEEKFRTITEQSLIGICITQDNKIKYINQAYADIFGYTTDEMMVWEVLDVVNAIHPDDRDFAIKQLEKKQKGDGDIVVHYVYRGIKKSGDIIWVDQYSKPIIYEGKTANFITIVDISERKIAEEKLKISESKYRNLNNQLEQKVRERTRKLEESESKFKLLYENAPLAYQSLDYRGNILDVNQAWLDFLGYKKEEVIGEWFGSFIEKKYLKVLETRFPKFKDEGEVIGVEYEVIKKDGSHAIVSFTGKIGYDDNMNFERTHCIFHDITERKKAEEKLKKSEEKYRLLFENMNEGFALHEIIIDENNKPIDYTFLEVNPAFELLTGLKANDIVGKKVTEILPGIENDPTDWIGKYGKVALTRIPITFENYAEPLDQWYSVAAYSPQEGYFAVTFTDITKRKKVEQQIKELNKQLEEKIEKRTIALRERVKELTCLYKLSQLAEKVDTSVEDLLSETLDIIPPAWQYPSIICARIVYNGQQFQTKNFVETNWNLSAEIKVKNKKVGLLVVCYLEEKHIFGKEPFLKEEKDLINAIVEILGRFIERKNANQELKTLNQDLEMKVEERTQELKKSEKKFRMIFNNANDAIAIIDLEGKILECNQTTSERLGYTKEELLLMNLKDFDTPKYAEGVLDRIEKVRQGSEIFYEIEHLRKDGLVIPTEVNSKLINFQGKPAILSLARDITIRKKAEEKLRESEEKVRNLVNNISDVLIEANVDGVFTFISPQIFRLIESRSEEIINSKLIEMLHPEDQDPYQESFKVALNSKAPLFLECKIRHKKGYYIPISIRGSFVEINNVNKFFGVISDITERKQIENMIKKEIKTLKEIDKIRNDLVTRMSHELKTPLISIFSGTEFLLHDYGNQLTEQVKTVISDIHDGGYRLKIMVENLLTVFEIDSEKIKFRPTKENVVRIIKQCIEDIIFKANKRNISINVELQDNLFLDVDKDLIQKAIFNIISNAVKNTPPNGNVYISTIEHHNFVKLVIKDTGVGITKKEMVDLFKPFGKIERYGKGLDVDIEGPGLGLYIANEIIKLHEGEIVLKSKGRNKGSTFTIRLNQTSQT